MEKETRQNKPAAAADNGIKPDDGLIVLKNITKRFGNNVVLDDISLAIEKGKTTVVIGPSGCGKSVRSEQKDEIGCSLEATADVKKVEVLTYKAN